MSDFDRIEEEREAVVGLEYDEHRARLLALEDFPEDDEDEDEDES